MLIKNCIYCMVAILSLFSIVSLIYSIKNKNKYICNFIIVIDITYIIYLIVDFYMLDILYIPVGLEVLYIYFFEFVAGILFIASIIINSIKRKKAHIYTKNSKVVLATIMLVLIPIIFLSSYVLENKYLINNSDLILVYESNGNGGFGDRKIFAYAIGEDFCKQFDLGINFGGYELRKFIPKNSTEISDFNNILDYKIDAYWKEDNNTPSTSVYKNNKKICEINNHYFNIDFKKGFYIKH